MSGMEQPDDISEFLKKMGMRDDHPEANQWDKIIQPNSSYLIIGDVGTGKSALAFYLLETYSQKYELAPVVVGLPENKQRLLPENFVIADNPDKLTQIENAICFVDEADIPHVVAPRIRWQGMLKNPLCSFWSDGLSEVWAGAEIEPQEAKTKQIGMFPGEIVLAEIHGVRKGWKVGEDDGIIKDERGEYFVVTEAMERRRIEVKRSKFEHSLYITYLDPITQIYWVEG